MFNYSKFDVTLTRDLDDGAFGWPAPGEAMDDSGLGGNRQYADLRRISWTEARRVYELETELIARIERAEDTEQEWGVIEDELYDEPDENLYGLDLGVAATVVALSAAGCIPFASCNAGVFGGHHHERYPLVGFFARAGMLELLLKTAAASNVGLERGFRGSVIAFADDIRAMRHFAIGLTEERAAFRALRGSRSPKPEACQSSTPAQLSLFS